MNSPNKRRNSLILSTKNMPRHDPSLLHISIADEIKDRSIEVLSRKMTLNSNLLLTKTDKPSTIVDLLKSNGSFNE